MADEQLLDEAMDDGRESADPEILRRIEESESLSDDIRSRYRDIGLQLLSDDVPTRLEPRVRARLEGLMGRDLSDVRVHTGGRAQQAADALGAQAFALGERDVFFGRGSFAPETRAGIGLLAHEVAHTVEAGEPGGAAVGFKRNRGGEGQSQREEFAEAAEERVLAQEDGPGPAAASAAAAADTSASGTRAATKPGQAPRKKKYLDALLIERLAWQKLRLEGRRDEERYGRF